jgi:predicted DNA-binding transcriptional regulator AlpA
MKSVLREREAAEMLGVSTAALRRWRRERRGPAYIRMERCVGYRVSDLEAFLDSGTVTVQENRSADRRE